MKVKDIINSQVIDEFCIVPNKVKTILNKSKASLELVTLGTYPNNRKLYKYSKNRSKLNKSWRLSREFESYEDLLDCEVLKISSFYTGSNSCILVHIKDSRVVQRYTGHIMTGSFWRYLQTDTIVEVLCEPYELYESGYEDTFKYKEKDGTIRECDLNAFLTFFTRVRC